DDGQWISATPDNGIFDTSNEKFRFSTSPLSPGDHAIEIEAFNESGAHSKQSITVKAPAK
ncbi:MAG TPA: hypothetical protein VGS41_12310, partial [Chthonomonadales bacterium]|nr:hypothetical protein [Chthonomonadales bacterium]